MQPSVLTVTYQSDVGKIELSGEITEPLALSIEAALERLFGYFAYDNVVLRIDSPGGALNALSHIVQCVEHWRRLGREVHTQANFTVASAGAILLACGHVGTRLVQRHTAILFHQSRITDKLPSITAEGAAHIAAALRRSDDRVLNSLVSHVSAGMGGAQALCKEGLARCDMLSTDADSIAAALGIAPPGRSTRSLAKIQTMYRECERKSSLNPYERHLVRRLEQDATMTVSEAYALNLIDQVWGASQFGLRGRRGVSNTPRRPVLVAA